MNFTLRPWQESDIPSLSRYANNPNIAKNLTDQFPFPYTVENASFFIKEVTTREDNDIMAIDIDGQAVGGIGLHFKSDIHRKNMELGYWIAEPFWGHGIMTNALIQRVEYAFEEYEVHRLYASVFVRNVGSWKVLEKAGFIREGYLKESLYKNDRLEDEYIYSMRRTL